MKQITSSEFEQLRSFIYANYGIHLTEKKKTLVMSRLNKVLIEHHMDSYQTYIEFLKSDVTGEAVSELLNRITTNHTFFLRENRHFDYFKRTVLPELERKYSHIRDLRTWSAGCSTGDEAYTISILMKEHFKEKQSSWDFTVLATDISRQVLDHAIEGVYEAESIKALPEIWLKNYFISNDEKQIEIKESIRKNVIFRRFNLMNPFPFKKPFHVIFCRNVMIYFDKETKQKLIKKFYDALEPGGYLFVGHSESVDLSKVKFKYVEPAIYRKE